MINLTTTAELHEQLATMLQSNPAALRCGLETANRELAQRRLTFGHVKPLTAAMTAFVVSQKDLDALGELTESLHTIIEKALGLMTKSPQLLEEYFPDHARLFPFLAKTKGSDLWQLISRYDVAITPCGKPKLMELNTGCPGGFMISEAMSHVTRHGFSAAGIAEETTDCWKANATIRPAALADTLLALEAASGIEPDTIGILNDENDLVFELDLVADALRRHGRQVVLANAEDLRINNGRLMLGNQLLSLVYNKFRISTPSSKNHCWKEGFETRYEAFLAAQQSQSVVSVNNVGGMLLAEDKSLLASLHSPEVLAVLNDQEQKLVQNYVLWTASLQAGKVDFQGTRTNLLPLIAKNKNRFVIKPANEGRGFGVVVGKFASDAEWQTACVVDVTMPKIVQEYTETVSFPVVFSKSDDLCIRDMYLTLGLAILNGKFRGLVSRVSGNAVTNVAREGFGQAAFVS